MIKIVNQLKEAATPNTGNNIKDFYLSEMAKHVIDSAAKLESYLSSYKGKENATITIILEDNQLQTIIDCEESVKGQIQDYRDRFA